MFDFDGTLTVRDSLLPFLRFLVPPGRLLAGLAASAPAAAGQFLGAGRGAAKEALLRRFVRGLREEELAAAGAGFARARLPRLVRPAAPGAIAWHRERGHRVVLVSASLEVYLAPWGASAGFDDVLATRLEAAGGRLTGRFLGLNCRGPEKVERLRALLGTLDGPVIHAYGDSGGDRELLAIATYPHYRSLRPGATAPAAAGSERGGAGT